MPTDLQRIQNVFQAVAELPPAERAAALERERGGDAELRRRVEALLKAHDDSGELPAAEREAMSWPTRLPTTQAAAAGPPAEPGQLFAGRYKLLQQIGEGGMGTVWMADQAEPVKRRVAVKLIRVDHGQSKTILSRFEAERQATSDGKRLVTAAPRAVWIWDLGGAGTHYRRARPLARTAAS